MTEATSPGHREVPTGFAVPEIPGASPFISRFFPVAYQIANTNPIDHMVPLPAIGSNEPRFIYDVAYRNQFWAEELLCNRTLGVIIADQCPMIEPGEAVSFDERHITGGIHTVGPIPRLFNMNLSHEMYNPLVGSFPYDQAVKRGTESLDHLSSLLQFLDKLWDRFGDCDPAHPAIPGLYLFFERSLAQAAHPNRINAIHAPQVEVISRAVWNTISNKDSMLYQSYDPVTQRKFGGPDRVVINQATIATTSSLNANASSEAPSTPGSPPYLPSLEELEVSSTPPTTPVHTAEARYANANSSHSSTAANENTLEEGIRHDFEEILKYIYYRGAEDSLNQLADTIHDAIYRNHSVDVSSSTNPSIQSSRESTPPIETMRVSPSSPSPPPYSPPSTPIVIRTHRMRTRGCRYNPYSGN